MADYFVCRHIQRVSERKQELDICCHACCDWLNCFWTIVWTESQISVYVYTTLYFTCSGRNTKDHEKEANDMKPILYIVQETVIRRYPLHRNQPESESWTSECSACWSDGSKRDTDTFFKRATAEGFYKFLNWMGAEVVYNHADYRLISNRVLQEFAKF